MSGKGGINTERLVFINHLCVVHRRCQLEEHAPNDDEECASNFYTVEGREYLS